MPCTNTNVRVLHTAGKYGRRLPREPGRGTCQHLHNFASDRCDVMATGVQCFSRCLLAELRQGCIASAAHRGVHLRPAQSFLHEEGPEIYRHHRDLMEPTPCRRLVSWCKMSRHTPGQHSYPEFSSCDMRDDKMGSSSSAAQCDVRHRCAAQHLSLRPYAAAQ